MRNFLLKLESLNKKLYLQMLALGIASYYAAIWVLQNIFYRGKFTAYIADAFSGSKPRPEPLEIPLYYLGFMMIPFLALALYYLQQRRLLKYVLGAVILVIIWKFWPSVSTLSLPDPRVFSDYLETKGLGKALRLVFTKRIYALRLAVFLSIGFFALVYFFGKENWRHILEKYQNSPWLKKFEPVFFILLGFVIFNPNLPYDAHHYNFVIGTVNDLLRGKALLYDTVNQYGILNVYFLEIVFKIFGTLTYEKFSFILFLSYYFYYLAFYYFLKRWLRSTLFAYFGVFVIVAVTYFLQVSPTLYPTNFPGMSPFRLGMYVPVLFLILRYSRTKSAKIREIAIIISSLAFFWNFDTGAYLAMATFLTLLLFDRGLKKLGILVLKYLGYPFAVWGIISLMNYFVYEKWPDWPGYFTRIFSYGKGLAQIRLPAVGFFEVFIFIYLSLLLSIIYRLVVKRQEINPILTFLTLYGIFSFTYYIGTSAFNTLYQVAVPLLLICVYFAYRFIDRRFEFSLFLSLLFFSLFIWVVKVPVELSHRNYAALGRYEDMINRDPELLADAATLRARYNELERLPLIHQRGTKILIYAEKTNYFDFFELAELNSRKLINSLIEQIQSEKLPYLLIEKQKNDQIEYVEQAVLRDYEKIDSLQSLDVYQRRS